MPRKTMAEPDRTDLQANDLADEDSDISMLQVGRFVAAHLHSTSMHVITLATKPCNMQNCKNRKAYVASLLLGAVRHRPRTDSWETSRNCWDLFVLVCADVCSHTQCVRWCTGRGAKPLHSEALLSSRAAVTPSLKESRHSRALCLGEICCSTGIGRPVTCGLDVELRLAA